MSDESVQRVSTHVDLRDDGLLWMINTTIFHPRGLTLAVEPASGELYLLSDGEQVWIFEEDLAEAGFEAFNALLERHQEKLP